MYYVIGEDHKPFDVSLDSFEHYYKNAGIQVDNFEIIKVNGLDVKVISKEGLIKCYEIALDGENTDKFAEYKRKIGILKNIDNLS